MMLFCIHFLFCTHSSFHDCVATAPRTNVDTTKNVELLEAAAALLGVTGVAGAGVAPATSSAEVLVAAAPEPELDDLEES